MEHVYLAWLSLSLSCRVSTHVFGRAPVSGRQRERGWKLFGSANEMAGITLCLPPNHRIKLSNGLAALGDCHFLFTFVHQAGKQTAKAATQHKHEVMLTKSDMQVCELG